MAPRKNTIANITELDLAGLNRLGHYLPFKDGLALSQSNTQFSLFYQQNAVRDFLRATIRGDEETALEMLLANPNLLMARGRTQKGVTTDYSGRKYSGLTAFQIALCAGDEVMAVKMKAIFLKAHPETGQAELDNQFNEIFPDGYEAHLKAQETRANEFDDEIIYPLMKAIDGFCPITNKLNMHIIDDLNTALRHENNDSALCQALDRFRKAFTALAQSEAVFNPNHFLKVLEKYVGSFDVWFGNFNNPNPHRWLRVDLFWRQVIGFMQRFLPANYGQAFCTGIFNMIENEKPLERRIDLYKHDNRLERMIDLENRHNNPKINLFPPDEHPSYRLGFDFAASSGGAGVDGAKERCVRWEAMDILERFSKLMSNKNSCLVNLCNQQQIVVKLGCCLIL